MNDGFFVTSAEWQPLGDYLKLILEDLVDLFSGEMQNKHRFMVRGAVAYGPVVHGGDINDCCCRQHSLDCRERILVGPPMALAYNSECLAPPFGIFIHETARMAPSKHLPVSWWRWWGIKPTTRVKELEKHMNAYFDWSKQHCVEIGYAAESIEKHRGWADMYFCEF
jgi:hypothetical protein